MSRLPYFQARFKAHHDRFTNQTHLDLFFRVYDEPSTQIHLPATTPVNVVSVGTVSFNLVDGSISSPSSLIHGIDRLTFDLGEEAKGRPTLHVMDEMLAVQFKPAYELNTESELIEQLWPGSIPELERVGSTCDGSWKLHYVNLIPHAVETAISFDTVQSGDLASKSGIMSLCFRFDPSTERSFEGYRFLNGGNFMQYGLPAACTSTEMVNTAERETSNAQGAIDGSASRSENGHEGVEKSPVMPEVQYHNDDMSLYAGGVWHLG